MKIYPSLISCDILNIQKTIEQLDEHCDGYHLDVMDDHFVPNLTWGPAFINAIANVTTKPLNVHLMVQNPSTWLDRLELTEEDSFIFHWESFELLDSCRQLIATVKEKGVRCGLAINPGTKIETIEPLVKKLDEVLILSVNPGFSGQKFMTNVVEKILQLVEIRQEQNLRFEIGIDGGVGADNIEMLKQKGVDFVGVASAIFDQQDRVNALKKLRNLVA